MPNIPPPFAAPYAPDDADIAARLFPTAHLAPPQEARIDRTATRLIEAIRKRDDRLGGVEDMLREFALSTKEGLALMVLAEALLRVPDARTADQFIEDKLGEGDFIHHETKSTAFLVNASAWALGLSARVIQPGETPDGTIGRLVKRLGAPVGLVHFDAHVDTWPDNFGQVYGHGSVFFHAINEGLVDPHRMIQIGIRSPVQREVWDWTIGQGVTILSAQDVHGAGIAATAARIRDVVGTAPCYLSFDIDALDPAFAPGTGTPEIGGLASWQAQALLRGLAGLDFRGMDIVEVAPAYDVAEITALAGASMVWEYLALIGGRFRG